MYSYTPYGNLATVADVLNNTYGFAYDVEGRLDTLYSPGAVWEHPTYDPDGRARRSQITVSNFVPSDTAFPSAGVRDDRRSYDARGKVLSAVMIGRSRYVQYSGLGMMRNDSTADIRSYGWWFRTDGNLWDALGNQYSSWQYDSWTCQGVPYTTQVVAAHYHYRPGTGRQTGRNEGSCIYPDPGGPEGAGGDTDSLDVAGNLVDQIRSTEDPYQIPPDSTWYVKPDPWEETLFYYGADQLLRVMDRQRPSYQNMDYLYGTFFEEYRYDALGRRILKRSRANSACASSIYCKSSIERYVWDGSQILLEIRYPGYDNVAVSDLERDTTTLTVDGRFYGRIAYTHAGGIDEPVGVVRVGYGDDFKDGRGYAQFAPLALSPHFSWERVIDAASYETGAAKRCVGPVNAQGHYYRCVQDQFQVRQAQQRSFGTLQMRPLMWLGSLLQGKMDEPGQLYMRNRYYDPVTGRFTQEDPVGLAFGLNLYGFAGGDPVNFSDPFGLCPIEDRGNCTQADVGSTAIAAAQECRLSCQEEQATIRGGNGDPGITDPVAILSGGLAAGADALLARSAGRSLTGSAARILANKAKGDLFRDEIAAQFEKAGYQVEKEAVKRTPFGTRRIDIEVSRGGRVLGGIETKSGASRYTPWQMAKDAWLRLTGYIVQVVRDR